MNDVETKTEYWGKTWFNTTVKIHYWRKVDGVWASLCGIRLADNQYDNIYGPAEFTQEKMDKSNIKPGERQRCKNCERALYEPSR